MLIGEEMENTLQSGTTVWQSMAVENRRNSYSEVVIERVTMKAKVFVRDYIIRKTSLNEGGDVVVCFPITENITERV